MLFSTCVPIRIRKNARFAVQPILHLPLSLPLDFSVMDSFSLDFAVMDFVPLGRFSRSYRALSVPVHFPHRLLIVMVHIPNWFISIHSPKLVHFVYSIALVLTS